MKLTIKAGLLSSLACLGTVAMLSSASAAGFSELDANADGQLDLAELEASFGANGQSTLEAYDTDADGMISVAEAEAMAAGAATTAETGTAETEAVDPATTAAEGEPAPGVEQPATAAEAVEAELPAAPDVAAEAEGAIEQQTLPQVAPGTDASAGAGMEATE